MTQGVLGAGTTSSYCYYRLQRGTSPTAPTAATAPSATGRKLLLFQEAPTPTGTHSCALSASQSAHVTHNSETRQPTRPS